MIGVCELGAPASMWSYKALKHIKFYMNTTYEYLAEPVVFRYLLELWCEAVDMEALITSIDAITTHEHL